MAGDVQVAVVFDQISVADTGSVDITKVGFGTPKACIVLIGNENTDGASVATKHQCSIGFSNFTDNFCVTSTDKRNISTVDCLTLRSAITCYQLIQEDGSLLVKGVATAITDGVRLTNTENIGTVKLITVIMFGGEDLQVSLARVILDANQDGSIGVGTNIDQDLVFFLGAGTTTEESSVSGIQRSFGVAHIDTSDHSTFVNRCMAWASDNGATGGSPASVVRNDRCLKILTESGSDAWGLEVVSASVDTYVIKKKDDDIDVGGLTMEVYALALDLDDRVSKIGSVDSPISGSSWSPEVSLGFTPQYVGIGLTQVRVEGAIETDEDAGVFGISSNTGAGEEVCQSWYNEDAADPTRTFSLFRSRAIDLRNDDASIVMQDHSHSSFLNGGWTYTINAENETAAAKWFYWAIEEAFNSNRRPAGTNLALSTSAPTFPRVTVPDSRVFSAAAPSRTHTPAVEGAQ